MNRRTIEKEAVNDISMEYIAKKIPTREERLIQKYHSRNHPLLTSHPHQNSITNDVADGQQHYRLVTTPKETKIIEKWSNQEINAGRIAEYEHSMTDLKKTFFKGCAATKNLSLEQTKQLTERFLEEQVKQGGIYQEQTAFFLLELLETDPNRDNKNWLQPNSFSNAAQRHLISQTFNLIQNEGGAHLDAMTKYIVLSKLQQLSNNNLQCRLVGCNSARGTLNSAITEASDEAEKKEALYQEDLNRELKERENLITKIKGFIDNTSKKFNHLTPKSLMDIIGESHKPMSSITGVGLTICDEYKNILDTKGEAAAIDFTRELKEMMQSPELDPLIPGGISSSDWINLQEEVDYLIAIYAKKVPDPDSIGVATGKGESVDSTATPQDSNVTAASLIEPESLPSEATPTRPLLNPPALENRDQPAPLAWELTSPKFSTNSLADRGQILAKSHSTAARLEHVRSPVRRHLSHIKCHINHIESIQKLERLAIDLAGIRSLDATEQKKHLAETKNLLKQMEINTFNMEPNPFTIERRTLLRTAKERVGDLERALLLVEPSKSNPSDIKKTALGFGGVAVCLTAIGALISLLVKLGQSEAVAGSESSDELMTDQTETIQAKQQNIETQQKTIKELADQEQDLLDKGANLAEDEIKRAAERAGLQEAINNNEVVYDNTNEGINSPKPSAEGQKTIEKLVNAALAEHQEHRANLEGIQSELNGARNNLEGLHQEMKDLQLQQGQYEGHREAVLIAAKTKSFSSHSTKTEASLLASLGIGALSVMGGAAGLFAVNNGKILPKFKLYRANKQATQSLKEVI